MQNLTAIIAIVALLFSASSLTVSVLAYRRDRSKVRALSSIEWKGNGPEPDTMILRVRIINAGRRPMALMSLGKKSGKRVWSRMLRDPELTTANVAEIVRELERSRLAHVGSVKLPEGEAYELAFGPDDYYDFIATHWGDEATYAESLFVEDVMGTQYPVRNSKKHLKSAFKEWTPPRTKVTWAKEAIGDSQVAGSSDSP